MSDQELDEDAEAAAEVLETIGPDVFDLLADVSRRYGVVISVHIAPNNRTSDDE